MKIGEIIGGMNVIDLAIIFILILFIIKGYKNGALKELVSFVGGILVIVAAYYLKNPVSVFLYENLPFLKFNGLLSGISVLNILVYELISFVAVASILLAIYKLLIGLSNILETILKLTIILEIPSKIFGLIVGFVEGVVVVFIILFLAIQFDNFSRNYVNESKLGVMIITKTPILSEATDSVYTALKEIYDIADIYKDSEDRDSVNLQALEVLLKYDILEPENAEKLHSKGKLTMPGIEGVILKYKKSTD